jgi:hypothetical protein
LGAAINVASGNISLVANSAVVPSFVTNPALAIYTVTGQQIELAPNTLNSNVNIIGTLINQNVTTSSGNTNTLINTSTVTVTPPPPPTPPTVQVTTQYITKTVEYISGTLYGNSGSTSTTISYNVVTKGNTIYPDGTTFQTSSSYSNANISNWGDSTVTTINIQTTIT